MNMTADEPNVERPHSSMAENRSPIVLPNDELRHISELNMWKKVPAEKELISTRSLFPGKEGSSIVADQQKFFLAFGKRVRELRRKHGHSQEDMNSFGFSARHWQQIEAGRPITVSTLLRICEAFKINADRLVRGLDRGIYGD